VHRPQFDLGRRAKQPASVRREQARSGSAEQAHRGWLEIRCQFGPLGPLNPLAAYRDQRTNGRKGRKGSKEESRSILPEDSVPGTKTVVIGACAPIHPRVGPAVRPDVTIRADLLLFLRPCPRTTAFS
jgi:hypothetical protein